MNKQVHQQRQEYLVQVQIIEVRDLKGKDKGGAVDPFVRISVGNLPPQVTTTRSAANTAVFNQSFTFAGLLMNTIEFESFEIKIEVYDQKQFGQNQLVGIYSVGISTLYRNPGHEIFNNWLPLMHPKFGLEAQGFLLSSAYVISPFDRPPVHDMNENNVEEEPDEFGGVPDDQLDPEQLQKRLLKKQQIAIVSKPQVRGKSYQLMVNIVKAEDLQLMGYGTLDSFISVRAGGSVQITSIMKNQQKPQYLSRLMFPLHFPFFNDKIVVRLWDKRSMMTDTFIAMIPEIPTENDYFNINFLQSKGGTMPFRWFNLYSIPYEERPSNFQEIFLGYRKSVVGTDYVGRVLMSINLTQSEKPELMVVPQTTQREPLIDKYTLRVDAYEIQEAKNCGEEVYVRFKVGGNNFRSEPAYLKREKVSKFKNKQKEVKEEVGVSYLWPIKKIQILTERLDLPQDPQQIPDLIVSLYTKDNKRVAYIRIPYHNQDLGLNRPKWYTFKSVKQTENSDVPHSFFLFNVMLRPEGYVQQFPRLIVKREQQIPYILKAYFYAGYDMSPDLYSEETMSHFRLKIGGQSIELDSIQQGKNPIWNKVLMMYVKIDQNLEFASNIIINFTNKHASKQKWWTNNAIGDVCISALSCKYEGEPQFRFHHIVNEGQSAGRILAAFQLQPLQKNDKSYDPNKIFPIDPIITQQDFHRMYVLFPVFGVRNLKQKMKDPVMVARIPLPNQLAENDKYYSEQSIEIITAQRAIIDNDNSWFGGGIQDPVFLRVVTLPVQLPPRLDFFPQVEVEIFDRKNKNERYICSVPLIDVAPLVDQQQIENAKEFFEQGRQFQDVDVKAGVEEHLQLDEDQVEKQEEIQKDDETAKLQTEKPQQVEQVESTIFDKKKNDGKQSQIQIQKQTVNQQKQTELKSERQKFSEKISATSTKFSLQSEFRPDNQIREQIRIKNIHNVEICTMSDLSLTIDDTLEQKTNNKLKSKKLLTMLKTYKNTYKQFEQLKTYIKREVEKLKSKDNQGQNYFKGENDIDEDEGYDYGREVLKGPYEEKLAAKIPFKRFPLYRLSSTKYGIIGNPTDAIIKGDIKLAEHSGQTKVSSKKSKKSTYKEQNKVDYSFNLFDQGFLNFFNEPYRLKVRLYILRCLNLAAQKQEIDTYHKMAGMDAICSADSYPEVFIGETGHDNEDLIKHITDQDRPILNTLSPNFFRMYELDATLPTDWKMKLHIKSKGMFNPIIGSLQIDIEDRVVGEEKLKQRIAFSVYRERFIEELETLKYSDTAGAENRKNFLKGQITDLGQRIENFDKKFKVPVEYKDLKMEGKQQASQGTVEMFLEVLPLDIAREIDPSPLSAPQPQAYEVRLIIWETFEIPKREGKKVVDIMLTVAMDASATGDGQEVYKETDVHNGSEKGDGMFSYRMKFPLVVPCPFPRLKMTVYDFSPFGTNESKGEATMSLKPIMKRLMRDGKYEMAPTRIKLTHPLFPGQPRGEVLVQMKILTKQAAEASPVGDAQDEPNEDPFLEKPTEGRGLADFFKGGFGFGNFMLYLKIFVAVVILVLLVMVLFVKPGILVN